LLKTHFKDRTFAGYRTSHGSEFLTSLCGRMTKVSIGHVRSLCSSIFKVAVSKDLIERNPWREVMLFAKPKESTPTGWYTLDEAQQIITDVKDQRARTAFGLSFFCGLRPGELNGLRFEDFDGDHVHIRRSVWRRHVGTTKTSLSAQRIPLIPTAKALADAWREVCGNPSEGFLFQNSKGKPIAITALTRPIKAILGKRWKGLYSARRGMGTSLTENIEHLGGRPRSCRRQGRRDDEEPSNTRGSHHGRGPSNPAPPVD
jgi:integrase